MFQLTNPPPKRKNLDVPNTTGTQKMLITGLSDLAGQQTLFTVDGDKPCTKNISHVTSTKSADSQ